MDEVVLETLQGDTWTRLGGVSEAEPPGSLASDEPDGRQVYLFGWLPDGTGPGVWRSAGGADVANTTVRAVVTVGLDQVADLTAGTHVQAIHQMGGQIQTRFQLRRKGVPELTRSSLSTRYSQIQSVRTQLIRSGCSISIPA